MNDVRAHPASFRDPAGRVVYESGELVRHVGELYRTDLDEFERSGLAELLQSAGLIVPYERLPGGPGDVCARLKPRVLPFVSYPFEWSFSQLKDAALATLRIQQHALSKGMSLKDASAYNIQFDRGRPIHIDLLSFERYREGEPWVAYRQFCQHFLAPLLLMSRADARLRSLLLQNLDGIPMDLASRLLPRSTWLRPGVLLHVHLHARSIRRFDDRKLSERASKQMFGRTAMLGLVSGLIEFVEGLTWRSDPSQWAAYVQERHYEQSAVEHKHRIVRKWLERCDAREVWDLGSNTGEFSRVAAEGGARVLALDSDHDAVENGYLDVRETRRDILPLVVDLANPSPDLGWAGRERTSILSRGNPDLTLALALVHHLAITNNVPLRMIVELLRRIAPRSIVEFVPKSDPQVTWMLKNRRDVFHDYGQEEFERAVGEHFQIVAKEDVSGTERCLYLLQAADE